MNFKSNSNSIYSKSVFLLECKERLKGKFVIGAFARNLFGILIFWNIWMWHFFCVGLEVLLNYVMKWFFSINFLCDNWQLLCQYFATHQPKLYEFWQFEKENFDSLERIQIGPNITLASPSICSEPHQKYSSLALSLYTPTFTRNMTKTFLDELTLFHNPIWIANSETFKFLMKTLFEFSATFRETFKSHWSTKKFIIIRIY
jgi:hypothetical protein